MIEIFNIICSILGIVLFFIPGIILDLLLFQKSTLLQRTAFSITLSASMICFLSYALGLSGRLNSFYSILSLLILSFVMLLILFLLLVFKKIEITTDYSSSLPYILFFSFLGTLWRLYITLWKFKNFGDAYGYAADIIYKSILATGSLIIKIPDIGFYKGMVIGHLDYFGAFTTGMIWEFLGGSHGGSLNVLYYINIFLGCLMYIGFVFILIYSISGKKRLAYLGAILMIIGPVEIWHSTLGFFGHIFAYISLFSLFLLFKHKNLNYFVFALITCCASILTYYTSAVAIIILCIGFSISTILYEYIYTQNKKEILKIIFKKEIFYFLLICLISTFFVFGYSHTGSYTIGNLQSLTATIGEIGNKMASDNGKKVVTVTPTVDPTITSAVAPTTVVTSGIPMPDYHYTGPFQIFGFPLLAIEDLIFVFCGLTFIFYFLFKKNREKNDIFIFLCCIPVTLLSLALAYINYYERISYYFIFFAIAAIKIPKKYFKYLAIFLIVTTIIFAPIRIYERPFWTTYDTEIEAAKFINRNLNGIVFTDQAFANTLIINEYYNVAGMADNDPRNIPLYRESNVNASLEALKSLNADYIVITERMRDTYILDLNIPQQHMFNSEMYEKNYKKVYDNGDVRVYSTEIKTAKATNKKGT